MSALGVLALLLAGAPVDVAPVWSGHPVGFQLLTKGERQYVAFYDAERRMTLAERTLPQGEWRFAQLDSRLVWDSHNYVTMAFDREGHLHVAGNMHVVPLVYFRSTRPGDITSMERVAAMTGSEETRVTYPAFLRNADGALVFTYRDGRSGSGNQIYNVYDEKTRAWRRLIDRPLTDGQGRMNAYFVGPSLGPDGYFHLIWVWRNTPDCATNHDLTYARSKDLVHWETSAGRALALPIRVETGEVVDAVPPGGGIINGNTRLGFDSRKRPVITYHKFDARGRTQLYTARLEAGKWRVRQVTDWDYRWEFQGGGAIVFEIRHGAVRKAGPGRLRLEFEHVKYGKGVLELDDATLKVVRTLAAERNWPAEWERPESAFPGMQVHLQRDSGGAPYVLRWETLGANRDRPRQPPLPEPSMLRVYALEK